MASLPNGVFVVLENKGTKFDNEFRGVNSGPDSFPGVWEKLMSDKDNSFASFVVKDNTIKDVKTVLGENEILIQFVYNGEIQSTYIVDGKNISSDNRTNENTKSGKSLDYPHTSCVNNIKRWIFNTFDNAKKGKSKGQEEKGILSTSTTEETTESSSKNDNNDDHYIVIRDETSNNNASGLSDQAAEQVKQGGWLGYPVVTALFFGACIVAGFVGGNMLAEKEFEIIDTNPLLFENFNPSSIERSPRLESRKNNNVTDNSMDSENIQTIYIDNKQQSTENPARKKSIFSRLWAERPPKMKH